MRTLFRCTLALFAAMPAHAQSTTATNAIILAGSGYSVPSPLLAAAPGQVMVLHVHGIATTLTANLAAISGPDGYPYTLNGISVDLVQGTPAAVTHLQLRAAYQTNCIAPCSRVTGITLQIPFELETNAFAKGDPAPQLRVSENGNPVG